jgi:DNA polymerase I-like protein with 3'-5' exonuclease and polymerase domains
MNKYSIRSMIVAPKGKLLVSVDLSQAESWIVAFSAKELNMQWSLQNSDIHTDTAGALFFPDNYCTHIWTKNKDETRSCNLCGIIIDKSGRYIGKRFNHATGYRMKAPRAAQVINKDSDKPPYVTVTLQESEKYHDRWHKKYHVKSWWKEIENQLNQNRTITTVYGRKRTFFRQWGDELFKEATAFIPQSTVADHFNGAIQSSLGVSGGLLEIYKRLVINRESDIHIINQSHDSCIIECPSNQARDIGLEMQSLIRRPLVIHDVEFTIPVDGEIGERWGELEPLK